MGGEIVQKGETETKKHKIPSESLVCNETLCFNLGRIVCVYKMIIFPSYSLHQIEGRLNLSASHMYFYISNCYDCVCLNMRNRFWQDSEKDWVI